jgi:hypothetical protein
MRLTPIACAIVLCSVNSAIAADTNSAIAEITAIHCGHLIDTVAGKLLGESTIVIEGKRI